MTRPFLPEPALLLAGRPVPTALRGARLLGSRLYNQDLAFGPLERRTLGVAGLLPARVMSIEEQVERELENLARLSDPLERYVALAALSDRNATLFYRLLVEDPATCLPVVYTPTVGLACQRFSQILRRTRGVWITPDAIERVDERLADAPYADVRLIVVTDNERILGLGDQGAGGMGISIGKAALYSAAGFHPSLTLPVSLDVGTDNEALLADPDYIGYRAPRLRGPAYDALVEAFVLAVARRWPGAIVQWEDFKGANALRLLERYRDTIPSFNDDIEGTAAVVLAGLLAAQRRTGRDWRDERIVLAGAGAAGTGIVRLLRAAMGEAGLAPDEIGTRIAVLDSTGLLVAGSLDPGKSELALAPSRASALGLAPGAGLPRVVEALRPTVLLGATGRAGTFSPAVLTALAAGCPDPVVMALSNPTDASEATPDEILAATGGRALVATGSPFEPVGQAGRQIEIGQANNAFIFPGVGLGAMVAEASRIGEPCFLAAARALAALVTDERLASGALYPPVGELRAAARAVAIAVAGTIGPADEAQAASLVEQASWFPDYPLLEPA